MDRFKLQRSNRYYSVLGLSTDASPFAIRSAYKKLAMKWHPDKCIVPDRAEAKRKFQEIQEAYAVLSDERKKLLYDNGLYDPEDDNEDIEGLSSFMNELSGIMAQVQSSEGLRQHYKPFWRRHGIHAGRCKWGKWALLWPAPLPPTSPTRNEAGKESSLEELQQLFLSMFSADIAAFNNPPAPSISFDRKRRSWGGGSNDPTSSYIESCISERFSTSQTHTRYFFSDTFYYGSNANTNAPKKTKCGKVAPNCVNSSASPSAFINKGNGLYTTTGKGYCTTTHDNGFSNKGR